MIKNANWLTNTSFSSAAQIIWNSDDLIASLLAGSQKVIVQV